MMSDNKYVNAARSFLGVPFRHQGRNSAGMDCVGLVVATGLACGHSALGSVPANYNMSSVTASLMSNLSRFAVERHDKDNPEAGDILLLRISTAPTHVGIYTGEGTFIHCYERVGKVVEHHLNPTWKARIVGVYKYE